MEPKVLIIVGTRPEVIKMAPVYLELKTQNPDRVTTCLTGQHQDLLVPFLDLFDWQPEYRLDTLTPGQSLHQLSAKLIQKLEEVIEQDQPDMILVHGDTTTTLMASLAAFHSRIPVGHVEAGLRTHDLQSPWPEEMNRRLTDQLSTLYFAPNEKAKSNLLAEGLDPKKIQVMGNTIVDAVLKAHHRIFSDPEKVKQLQDKFSFIDPRRKLILNTTHRRENIGKPIQNIFHALADLSHREDVQIIYPIHPNPEVKREAERTLSQSENIHLIDPIDYPSSIYLQSISDLIITDSGGIQEESLVLNRPLLVTREHTERPENRH